MKKRWLRRLIYFVVVAGTAGFAFYQYKQSQTEKQTEEKKDLVFSSLEMSQVQSVSIKRKDEGIYFFRKDGDWWLDSPVKDMADRDIVGDWLQGLLSEKVRVIREKGVDWEEYELAKNTKNIEITTISDEKLKLNISDYSAFDGSFYIRKGEQLLLGDTSWATLAGKDGNYFRSYKLLDAPEHPLSLRYSSGVFKVQLKMESYKWLWAGEAAFPLSHSGLESYWTAMTNVSFDKEVYSDTEASRKKFKLQTPDIEMELKFKGDKSWSVKISPEMDGKFYALVSGRSYIFTLNQEQREKILLTEKRIRDHRQPFQFEKSQAYFMDMKGYGLDIRLGKEKEKWKLLQTPVAEKEKKGSEEKKNTLKSKIEKKLNEKELETVLNRIQTLSAKQYFGKKSFVKTSHLILKDKDKKNILTLELSDPFESNGGKRVYVKSSKGNEVMALSVKDVEYVFSPSLLKIDEEKEKK